MDKETFQTLLTKAGKDSQETKEVSHADSHRPPYQVAGHQDQARALDQRPHPDLGHRHQRPLDSIAGALAFFKKNEVSVKHLSLFLV